MAILARALPSRLLAFLLVAALGALAPEAARAQNPTCGATITSDTVLADHLDCSGTTGIALTIEGDGVTFDGNGFRVIAPNAQSVIRVVGDDNVVRRVDVSNPNGRSGNGVMVNGAGNLVDRVTANNHYAGIRFDGQRNRVTASHADNCSFAAYISRGWNTIVDTTSLTNSAIGLYLEDTWAPADLDRPVFPVPESVTYDGSYEAIVIYSGGNLTFEKLTIDNPVALRASAAANITVRDSDLSAATPGGDGVALGGSGGFHVHDVVANDRTRGILVTGPGNLIHDSAADGCNWGVYISRGWDARVANLALTHNNVGLYLEDTWAPADLDRPVFPVPESVTYDGSHEAIVIYSGGNLTFEKLTIDNPVALRASAAANITVRDSDLSAATPGGDGVALGGSGGFHVHDVVANDRTRGILVTGPGNLIHDSAADGCNWGVYISRGWDARVANLALTHNNVGLYLEDTWAPADLDRPVFPVPESVTYDGSHEAIVIYSGGNLTFEKLTIDNPVALRASAAANITVRDSDLSAATPGGDGVALGGSGGFRVEGVIADDRTRGILVYGPNNSVRQSRSDGSHWGVYVSNGWDARVEGNALTHCKTGLYLEDTFAPSSMSRPVFQVAANNSFAGSETGIGLYSSGNLTFEDLALDNHYGFYGSRVANIDIVGGDFSAPGGAGGWGAYLAGDDNRLSDLSVVGRGVGVRLDGKGNSIATSDFSANQIAVVSNGSNTVNSSSFCGNTVAFYNGDNNAPSVATGNYWGAPSGPAPSGTGDAVSGAVTFTPFATQPPVGTGAFCGPVCGDGYCADDASENAATCEDDCYCGNGAIDGTEQCDGADLGGLTCASLGYDGGTLSCDPDCQLVEGECDNECATDNGGCAGTCTNTATGYTCTCPAGYQLGGDGHACDDVDECQADNGGCTIYQTCVNQVGAPPTCADIDECAADNGGCGDPTFTTCTDNVGAPPTCADIDECAADHGGCGDPAFTTCTDNAGAPPTCADIDECATDHGGCADGFACVDVEGGLPLCEDIDECADAGTCDANATCANTLGGFTCTCDPGYEGDGATCSPVTACTLGPDAVMWHSPLTRSGGAETSPPAFEFKLNDGTIRVSVNAQDCDGQNSSSNPNVIGRVSVFLDGDCDGLTEVGDYQLAIDFNGAGGPGGLMYKNGDKLTYNLSTANWPATNGCYALEVNLANVVTHESKTERVLLKPKRR